MLALLYLLKSKKTLLYLFKNKKIHVSICNKFKVKFFTKQITSQLKAAVSNDDLNIIHNFLSYYF